MKKIVLLKTFCSNQLNQYHLLFSVILDAGRHHPRPGQLQQTRDPQRSWRPRKISRDDLKISGDDVSFPHPHFLI